MARLFGTNGVRGVFGDDLTLEVVHDLVMSFATYLGRGPVLVGYDGRTSSPVIARVVCATLNACGMDCSNAGLVPTPCLEFATKKLGYAGGIMITASHNPPQYNGIKPCGPDGVEISRHDERLVEEIYFGRKWNKYAAPASTGEEPSAIGTYLDGIVSHIDCSRISSRKFKVVLDLGNGAQAVAAPEFCNRLGCDTVIINEEIDGQFPGRGSEPTPHNLSGLSRAVTKHNADIGVAFDGDGDRSILCDESGQIMTGDRSALVLTRHILKSHPQAGIVTCLNSGSAIDVIAAQASSQVTRVRVGSVEVSREMLSGGALVGFEENGGFMYGMHNHVRDGVMALGLALDMMATSDFPLSRIASSLPPSHTAKDKIPCTANQAQAIMDTLKKEHPDCNDTDGIKISLGPRQWVMIRASGTEPLVRIYAESDTLQGLEDLMRSYTKKAKAVIDSLGSHAGP